MATNGGHTDDFTRRRFLQTAAVGAGLLWSPVRRLTRLDAVAGPAPDGFPSGIELYKQFYENWALEIRADDVWTASPRNEQDVVTLANWAVQHGWRLRPSGARHGWAPFTVTPGQSKDARIILVDTREHLTKITLGPPGKGRTVTAQAGATMDDLMQVLHDAGRGFSSIPAPGDVTVAGVLAVNAHGAAIPAAGEKTRGRSFGSMSNRVVSLDAVVWDNATNAFVLRSFDRSQPITKALLTNLGRIFVTSATLRTEKNVNMRCVSYVDITAAELFSAPSNQGPRSFANFVEQAGRVEAIWFPTTTKPWLKVWSVQRRRPAASRQVTAGYNYPFSDNVPEPVARMARAIVASHPESTPTFGATMYNASVQGLRACDAYDIWGSAKNTQHYIKATTLRAAEFGYGVLTSRANIQRALHEFVTKYEELVATYKARGQYPSNMPLEIRCTGVDRAQDVGVPGAEPPALSGMSPRADHPEWDTVIWLNALTLVGTNGVFGFKHELEQWMLSNYSGDYATARVEWSKGWAYTTEGGWIDPTVVDDAIPNGFRAARTPENNWDWTIARFNELDPHRVFGNAFLDALLR
ncbi:MAG: hypothetical protein QOF21_2807 [Actinomycetota bacterium]|jgi:FAD/FMN-containing dehydrogenase